MLFVGLIVALAVVVGGSQAILASPVGGKTVADGELGPRKWKSFKGIELKGMEDTNITVSGDGEAKLVLEVFDADGGLIISSDGTNPSVTLTPKKNAKISVKISNLSTELTNFSLTAE